MEETPPTSRTPPMPSSKNSVLDLSVSHDGRLRARHVFQEDAVIVGRNVENTIQLPSPRVSRRHCRFERDEEGAWSLQDMGSSNGTLLNGERIEGAEVVSGDVVWIGPFRITVTILDGVDSPLPRSRRMSSLPTLGSADLEDSSGAE